MYNGMIHVQRSFREFARVRLTSSDWLKVDFLYKAQWQQIHRTVEQFSTNQNPGNRMIPSV